MLLNTLAGGTTLAAQVANILRKYGTDAHLYLPGIGTINGYTAGNFLDSAGTTDATVDNPVGLVLDGAGSVGSEIATPFNNTWTNNTNVSTSSGTLTATSASIGYLSFKDGFPITAGKTYKISFSYSTNTNMLPLIGGTTGASVAAGSGEHTQYIVAGATSRIQFNASGTFTGTISNLSVKEVTGIHATQPTTANKPILRRGAVNLLTYTVPNNQLPTNWSAIVGTGTRELTTLTNGLSGLRFIATSQRPFISQAVSLLANTTYTLSCYVEGSSSGGPVLQASAFTDATGTLSAAYAAADANGRISITFTTGIDVVGNIYYGLGCDANRTGDLKIAGLQLELGSTASPYIPTTSAAASSSTGNYYWQFDGSNDNLQCSSSIIENTGNDYAIISAFSADVVADKRILQVRDASNNLVQISLGVTNSIGLQHVVGGVVSSAGLATSYLAGEKIVVSGIRRGTELRIRKNGGVLSNTTTPQTGANPIAANMYLGCQQGTSLFFQGKIYPQIVIKGTVQDADLLTLERFVGSLSGVSI